MERKHTLKVKLDRKSFISKKLEDFHKVYAIDPKPIGKGAYSEIYRCTHLITKELRAVKTVSKYKMQDVNGFLNEVDCLKNLVNWIWNNKMLGSS